MTNDEVIKTGEYIIIQKQNYKKLHKLNKPNSSITFGRDSIHLRGIEGCPYFSVFKMMPNSKKGREYRLELTEEAVQLKDEIDIKISGADNRHIVDDGRSQKLSKQEIEDLTSDANKASDIVETLISNSNTFYNKTEFSQEKYLKKKEKKYSEYLQILKPNLRMIADIMYKLEPGKIHNLRIDTLSQIMTLSNVQCEGCHLLYDSGSNGLLAAALLSAIGQNTEGKLVHMHPGNMSQKQALLAMNFSEEHLNRCISVNIYSVLRLIYQGNENNTEKGSERNGSEKITLKRKADDDTLADHFEHKHKVSKHENCQEISSTDSIGSSTDSIGSKSNVSETNTLKRDAADDSVADVEHKHKVHDLGNYQEMSSIDSIVTASDGNKYTEPKKPKWHYENLAASELLSKKMDSLVMACKEDPQNIFFELLPFVKPGRPFVIYYTVAEPLQNLYTVLKSHSNVAALKLTCNWLRNYQILPERTHPEVMMNAQSGFLLTGYVLQ